MKTKIFTLVALLCAAVFASCSKEDGIDYKVIDIEIESNGGEYTFSSSTIDVVIAPDDYYAEVENNTIIGKYAGTTTAQIVSDGVTYDCNITVSPSYTYYIDMAIYMGWSKSAIENLFGESIYTSDSVYGYNPLSEYFSESAVAFIYENNKVVCAASYFSIYNGTYVIKHLSQRYVAYGVSNSVAYFANAYDLDDATLMVAYNYSNTSYTYVMYLEYSADAVSMTKSADLTVERYNAEMLKFAETIRR